MLVIRVVDCRDNLIKLYDILKLLGYSCETDLISDLQSEYKKSQLDVLQISNTILGDINEIRYVRCFNDSGTKYFRIYRGYVEDNDTVKADVETVFTALRVKSSREAYKDILNELIGSIDVPDKVERYARMPRMQLTYYTSDFETYRLYDFEAEEINRRNLDGVSLRLMTAEIYEDYCKKIDKRIVGTANVIS